MFGATALDAEHSRSLTVGLTASLRNLTVTLDHYRIRLDDRITLSSQFLVGPAEAERLAALGVPGASDIAQVRFFTNDVQTATRGVDIVASWQFDDGWLAGASLQAAFNFNETEMLDRGSFVGAESQFDIENGMPAMRGVITARHAVGPVDAMLRARVFGKYKNAKTWLLEDIQSFGREVMVDLEAGWTFRSRYRVKLGIQNLFDNYPAEAIYETCCGMVYRRDSIVPWQGRLTTTCTLALDSTRFRAL